MDDLSKLTPEELVNRFETLSILFCEKQFPDGGDDELVKLKAEILHEIKACRAMKAKAEEIIAEWDGQPITDGAANVARQILAAGEEATK